MIVIDVGCARYGGDYSIERLLEEFKPTMLYGFDPNWETSMFEPPEDLQSLISVQPAAAWTYDGHVEFAGGGLGGHIEEGGHEVRCFDLADFVRKLPSDHEVIIKIDAETAEYEILEHLMATGTDDLLKLVWVEWHCEHCGRALMSEHLPSCPDPAASSARRQAIEDGISCEIVEWRW